MPTMSTGLFPAVFAGLFLVTVLAAIMSTLFWRRTTLAAIEEQGTRVLLLNPGHWRQRAIRID